ncbi:hypothetical protein [Virgisporangium aurantiacum]|uniref:Uncharacterized protein n=1 Tax=Virgisporangium aurantiacum TaxID=175570 RepID=A0A8J4E4W7_9ACTN|nr:hypothetical protein [Virgisporangium aurantiacum]GIJ62395.1 hypothetical protein Vau01_099110 [Virgisporangium aurantiacum]
MTDLESRIVDTLRHRPDPDVHIDTLTRRAVVAGRARRRRTVVTAVAAAVALVGVGIGVGVAVGRPDRDDAPAVPPTEQNTNLPTDPVSPTAADRPSAVGTDPGVLHFDLDGSAIRFSDWRFETTAGREQITLAIVGGAGSGPFTVDVQLSPDPLPAGPEGGAYRPDHEEQTEVGGRTATWRTFTTEVGVQNRHQSLSWEPVAGLYAQVSTAMDLDLATVRQIAAAARFDRAQRCVAPVRVTALPAGARWTGCQVRLRAEPDPSGGRWVSSRFTLVLAAGNEVEVHIDPAGTSGFQQNRTVNRRPARWESASLWIGGIGPFEAAVFGNDGRLREEDGVKLGAGIKPVGDPADLTTWAPRPVG